MSDRVGVRELRNQVAAVLRRAGSGERIVVTVDGRPVAQIGPVTPGGSPTLDDLVAAGLVEPPRVKAPMPEPVADEVPVDAGLDKVIDEIRGG